MYLRTPPPAAKIHCSWKSFLHCISPHKPHKVSPAVSQPKTQTKQKLQRWLITCGKWFVIFIFSSGWSVYFLFTDRKPSTHLVYLFGAPSVQQIPKSITRKMRYHRSIFPPGCFICDTQASKRPWQICCFRLPSGGTPVVRLVSGACGGAKREGISIPRRPLWVTMMSRICEALRPLEWPFVLE